MFLSKRGFRGGSENSKRDVRKDGKKNTAFAGINRVKGGGDKIPENNPKIKFGIRPKGG